ncbi:MAG: type II toxin-antitoxin system RelE/ParE family toxin [Gracilibacteraceae bacterium]|nr:type II toxin-antitoxin system RelE/ParE family toxin [Gracilibacteraceae bacterium]
MAYKYTVRLAQSAERDIDEILAYIAETLQNPKAAADLADELDARFETLESQPLMFELSVNVRLRRRGYRRFPVKNYVVFYQVDEAAKAVIIARVFYGRQDYERLL